MYLTDKILLYIRIRTNQIFRKDSIGTVLKLMENGTTCRMKSNTESHIFMRL